ncbi:hypothetical protein GCM10027048_21200 [Hymenobacter coalescens]
MTQRTTSNHVRLGLFVLLGLSCLIAVLFLLGRQQNLFSRSLEVQADFRNVSGLLTGNNVRLGGIPVGTVRRIQILNDTTVRVVMNLNRDVQPFVRKNAVAAIGTDGLVGNTIVNLNAQPAPAPPVAPGDVLRTVSPVGIDEMLSTLNVSNRNLIGITQDLRQITSKLNGSDPLWRLLNDEQLTADVRQSLRQANEATARLQAASRDVQLLTRGVRQGHGPAGYLLTDTAFAGRLGHASRRLASTSDTLAATLGSLKQQVQTGNGPLNTLLADTAFARQLRQSMHHVEQGTAGFSQSMEALQHNFLVRGYLKRQQKKQARAKQTRAAYEPAR